MQKKEFVDLINKKVEDFLDFIDNTIIELYKTADSPIQKRRLNDLLDDIKQKSLDQLTKLYKLTASHGAGLGIGANDEEAGMIMDKFMEASDLIQNLDPEKIISKNKMKDKEPTRELFTVEEPKVISINKEEIGDKLIDLNEQKKNTTDEQEIKDIENKIKYYMRLYQESSLRRKRVA